jgi:predicted MFS family arabinose efflux permease
LTVTLAPTRARGVRGAPAAALVAAAFLITMLGTTMPTPLYPLYERELGFGGLMVTVIFATYAVGVGAALMLFGQLSDQLGRRPLLLAGLACAALSAGAFLIPHSLPALFAGRLLSGLSAGVFTGTATATLVDLAPEGRAPRYSLLAAMVNMLGLGLGPVLAGALAEFAPDPLVTPYLVHLGLVVLAGLGLLVVADPVRRAEHVRWRLQKVSVPGEARPAFVRAATAGFAGFAVLGLFTAVAPAFLGQVLGVTDHLATGLVVFAVLGASTVGQLASVRLPARSALLTGCALLVLGVLAVGGSLLAHALWLLVGGAVLAGLGQGMSFRAGLGAVTGSTPAERRGEVSSSFFLVLYVAISLPVIGVGAAAQAFGLVAAGVTFTGLVALLAAVAFVRLRRL